MHTRDLQPSDARWAADLIRDRWLGPLVVTQGLIHDTSRLPGYVACEEERPIGLLLYREDGGEIEVVTLDAIEPRRGVGRLLLQAVSTHAVRIGAQRIWLVTTNDNVDAIGFYAACGFRLVAVHRGAVANARVLKPEIPLTGLNGVAVTDELEFEWCNFRSGSGVV